MTFSPRTNSYGAKSVLLSSASSKTAYGLAHLVHAAWHQGDRPDLGRQHVDFVKSLGCYDEVVTYDDVTSLPADQPWPMSTWPATARYARRCTGTSASR